MSSGQVALGRRQRQFPARRRGQGLAATVIWRSPAVVGRVAGELLYRDFAA